MYLQDIFAFYLSMFFLYLILLSTKESDKKVVDPVLGRKVPLIVFIKNKNLLKKVATEEICDQVDQIKKDEINQIKN